MTTKPKINLSKMEEILQGLESSVLNQFNAISPKAITESIMKDFKDARAEVLYKLMGFQKGYGDKHWSVDHCNGRAGNSPIGDWIKDACEAELRPFILELMRQELGENGEAFKKMAKEAMHKEMTRMFSSYLYDEIKSSGKKIVEEFIKEQKAFIEETIKQRLMEKADLVEKDG